MTGDERRTLIISSPGGATPRAHSRAGLTTSWEMLTIIHADLVAPLAETVQALLGPATVSLASLVESTAPWPTDGLLLPFSCATAGAGALHASPELVTLLLDNLLGFSDERAPIGAPMSDLTRQFLYESLTALLPAYAQAWAPYHALTPVPQPDAPAPASGEACASATYQVSTARGQGALTILLPLAGWHDTLAACLPPTPPAPSADRLQTPLLQAIGKCQVPVRVIFGSTQITVRDLLNLQVGDIICLDQSADAPQALYIGHQPKLHGVAQLHDGRYLITVTPTVEGASHGVE